MADPRALAAVTEPELEDALRELGRSLAWPDPADPRRDIPTEARQRIVAERLASRTGRGMALRRRRSIRWSIALAMAAVLLVVAVAAGLVLGVPGIRITTTSSPIPSAIPTSTPRIIPPGTPAPSPSPGPLGWQLGLGQPFAVEILPRAVSFGVRLPPSVGEPASAWFLDGRVSAVWPNGPSLPEIGQPGVGLVLTEMQGDVDPGYFDKIVGPGTTITPVQVAGAAGYWISGRPHEMVFVDPSGEPVFDTRRIVGDTLIWARDGITYRLESGLGQAAAIALATSLR